jgi:serine/threonine-protein kinase
MMTGVGVILGTAAYMSPEQAKGRAADKRSDVWAFGCVLYEMLAGKRAFEGEDVSDTLAAVLRGEPDWSALPPDLSNHVRLLIKHCLEKDRRARVGDIGVARMLLGDMGEALAKATAPTAAIQPPPVVKARRSGWIGAGVVAGVAAAAVAFWIVQRSRPAVPAPQPARFTIVPPASQPLSIQGADRDLAIAPDGSFIVYRAGTTQTQLMIRGINDVEAKPLAGTTNARYPFVSPDGRWVAFLGLEGMMKVSVTGGTPIRICQTLGGLRGASWVGETIVFATVDSTTGLLSVAAGGGEPKVLTKPDRTAGEIDHWFPSILPGGNAVVFTIASGARSDAEQVALLDLKTGKIRTLIRGASAAEYVESGHLLYATGATLRAAKFDLNRLDIVGDPVPVLDQVTTSNTGAAEFAVSRQGSLVYIPGGVGTTAGVARSLVWVDRQGHQEPINAPQRTYAIPRISPDGTRAALDIRDEANDIWILDFQRRTLDRLTRSPNTDMSPVWTPDGRRIIWANTVVATPNLFWQAADGTGEPEPLTVESTTAQFPTSISPDGRTLALFEASGGGVPPRLVEPNSAPVGSGIAQQFGISLFTLPVAQTTQQASRTPSPEAKTQPILFSQAQQVDPEISPDGHWLAYASYESGQEEIYVRPFPNVNDGRVRISTEGGSRPAWAHSSRELFYLDTNGLLTVVPVPIQAAGTTFKAGIPTKLLNTAFYEGTTGRGLDLRGYDVSPDGQRFLMIKDAPAADQSGRTSPGMVVVLNWFEELRAKTGK